ncbi:unnamed protein product [Pedinophyceae sp. YPF-701]|nr:unnamed protein product [Pedinophyceae sp. YPF-701]
MRSLGRLRAAGESLASLASVCEGAAAWNRLPGGAAGALPGALEAALPAASRIEARLNGAQTASVSQFFAHERGEGQGTADGGVFGRFGCASPGTLRRRAAGGARAFSRAPGSSPATHSIDGGAIPMPGPVAGDGPGTQPATSAPARTGAAGAAGGPAAEAAAPAVAAASGAALAATGARAQAGAPPAEPPGRSFSAQAQQQEQQRKQGDAGAPVDLAVGLGAAGGGGDADGGRPWRERSPLYPSDVAGGAPGTADARFQELVERERSSYLGAGTGLLVNQIEISRKLQGLGVEGGKSGLTREQADAVTQVIAEISNEILAKVARDYATTAHVRDALRDLAQDQERWRLDTVKQREMDRASTQRDIQGLQNDVRSLRVDARHELEKQASSQRLDLNLERSRLREELKKMEEGFNQQDQRVEREIHVQRTALEANKNDMIKYFSGTLMTFVAIGATMFRLFMS